MLHELPKTSMQVQFEKLNYRYTFILLFYLFPLQTRKSSFLRRINQETWVYYSFRKIYKKYTQIALDLLIFWQMLHYRHYYQRDWKKIRESFSLSFNFSAILDSLSNSLLLMLRNKWKHEKLIKSEQKLCRHKRGWDTNRLCQRCFKAI